MNPARIAVFAYSDLGHACLKFLFERGEKVVAVYTHEDAPGEKIWFPSVAQLARDHGVPVSTEEDLKNESALAALRASSPDLIFSFYYRHLLPASVLSIPPKGAYNMHGSLLPKYRGRAPINWAVLNGETVTGATLHAMTAKADAGDIIDQESVPIGPDDTAAVVQANVTKAAVAILSRQLEKLKAGTAVRFPQDTAPASYFGRRRPEDGAIDWRWPAQRVHNLVRALSHPYPGAFGTLNGEKFLIWKTRLARPEEVGREKNKLTVQCGDGRYIEVLALEKPGENEKGGEKP